MIQGAEYNVKITPPSFYVGGRAHVATISKITRMEDDSIISEGKEGFDRYKKMGDGIRKDWLGSLSLRSSKMPSLRRRHIYYNSMRRMMNANNDKVKFTDPTAIGIQLQSLFEWFSIQYDWKIQC